MSTLPRTLLLADDSVTIRRVVELTFADEDIRVIAVSSGDQAIASMRHTPPDIVLADVGMPDGNGYDVARHIRRTPALAHIPVLLLTGAFESIDRVLALEAGCEDVVTKPFAPHVLVQRVRELLDSTSGEPPLASVDVLAERVRELLDASGEPRRSALEAVEPSGSRPTKVARLDDYFEELDQALAARVGEGLPATADPGPAVASPDLVPAAGSVRVVAPLAGAFSALLAAEQDAASPDPFADWLPDEPVPAPISEEVIDTIVGRVIDRLSETVVRDAVRAVASSTAERLIREEIDRIKSNIK